MGHNAEIYILPAAHQIFGFKSRDYFLGVPSPRSYHENDEIIDKIPEEGVFLFHICRCFYTLFDVYK